MRLPLKFGLVAVLVVVVAFIALPLLHRRATSVGFEVLVLKEGPKVAYTDHWGNVLVVHIDGDHSWSLNSQKLSRSELRHVLEERLCRRAEKVVLFDGNSDITFDEAAQAIDTIRTACPTTIALVTPNVKKIDPDRLYLPDPHNDSQRGVPESAVPEALR
jgi:biopolymer transport protein ExbD